MTEFNAKVDNIVDSFKTESSVAWLQKTGRRAMANKLLDAMRAARSPDQFNELAYEFKRQVLMPYYREVVHRVGDSEQRQNFLERNQLMAMPPPKKLPPYEELRKNPAFAESQYRTRVPGDTTSYPRLLRASQDPVEMDLAARKLGVTPEDLKEHIRTSYNDMVRKKFQKDFATAAMQGQAYRDSLAKDYEESTLGTILNMVSPEVTQLTLSDIRRGKESDGWEYAKAIAKDALVGIGSLYTGNAAGLVTKFGPARAALGGLADAGLELARQGMSNYSDWDLANAGGTGFISATMPAGVGILASAVGNIGHGAKKLVNPIMRKIRGMVNDPVKMEAERAAERAEAARRAIEAREGGSALAREGATDVIDELGRTMENSPARVYDNSPLTREEVTDIVMDPERAKKYFTAPTADEFTEQILARDLGTGAVSDNADEWLKRAKAEWPEAYKEISTPKAKKTKTDVLADAVVEGASREETMRARSHGKKKEPDQSAVSPALEQVMQSQPDLIRVWKAGFVPEGSESDPMVKLYTEWKTKFGG